MALACCLGGSGLAAQDWDRGAAGVAKAVPMQ